MLTLIVIEIARLSAHRPTGTVVTRPPVASNTVSKG